MRSVWLATIALVLCACRDNERALPDRSPRTAGSAAGAVVAVPAGWSLTEGPAGVRLLEDPERTLRAWFIELAEPDAGVALAEAWQRVMPGFALAIAGEPDRPPPTGGWDAITNVSYAATDERVVEARARRLGDRTYVTLIDATRAAMSRRGPQLEEAIASLRPPGLADESFAGRQPRALAADQAAVLDGFVTAALDALAVPGAAIAVVHDGSVIYERTFGVRALGGRAPITPNTRFMIGSITKSMTTLMQAALVDANVLAWSTPLVSLLPSFSFGDAELTRSVEVWHTSCACTGMPPSLDHLFEYEHISAEQLVASLAGVQPTTKLGETYQYSNQMVAVGGFIAAHAYAPKVSFAGAYARAMRDKVFTPIGMTATTVDFTAALRGEHALPHAEDITGVMRPLPVAMERNVLPIAPAGAVWSTLRDMERYVRTELARGVAPDGRRVVSATTLGERWQRRVGDAANGYGLGINVDTYHGVPKLGHDGGALGYGASVFMLPEQQLGIIVLTNARNDAPSDPLPFNTVVIRRVIEAVFDGAKPLAAQQLAYFTRTKAEAATRNAAVVGASDQVARLAPIAGVYTNDVLGTVTLTLAPGGMTFDVGEWKRLVKPLAASDGSLAIVHVEPPFAGASFTIDDPDGTPSFTLAYAQARYVFTRMR